MAVPMESRQQVLASINITPLVDVMLVLLVIFMITAPALTRTIEVDLPQPVPNPDPPARRIDLRIDAGGSVYWNGAEQPLSALQGLLEVERQRQPENRQPLLAIDASGDADYQAVTAVLAARATRGWTGSASSGPIEAASAAAQAAASRRAR